MSIKPRFNSRVPLVKQFFLQLLCIRLFCKFDIAKYVQKSEKTVEAKRLN